MPVNMQAARVMIIYGREDSAQRYRCQHVLEQLRLYGVACEMAELRHVSLACLRASALVIFHRIPYDKFLGRVLKELRRCGVITVFDTDDLIFDLSVLDYVRSLAQAERLSRALYRHEVERYRQMMEEVDAVLVSTEYLARQAARLNEDVRLHRNAFSLAMQSAAQEALARRARDDRRMMLGYACGSATHEHDFRVVQPALRQLLVTHPQVELWLIGQLAPSYDWGSASERVKRLPFVPWRELPGLLAQCSINLAPLELDNPFCLAKSEIKYVEAALVKTPTVASRTETFEYATCAGDNGLLARTADEWAAALHSLVTEREQREALAERACADVLERYHPLTRGRELLGVLNELGVRRRNAPLFSAVAVACPEDVVGSDVYCSNRWTKPPSLARRAFYALRARGGKIMLMQTILWLQQRATRAMAKLKTGI
jgi:glycosyltransferase involved in cell wall biosynthesis